MALRKTVIIKHINNLSDARYCAGMGADYLGFSLEKDSENFLDPDKYRELISWVSGPENVGEFYNSSLNEIINILSSYSIKVALITDIQLVKDVSKLDYSVILEIGSEKMTRELAEEYSGYLLYFLVWIDPENTPEIDRLSELSMDFPILVGGDFSIEKIKTIIEQPFIGISLQGGNELKPGFREFDKMADILELLEVED